MGWWSDCRLFSLAVLCVFSSAQAALAFAVPDSSSVPQGAEWSPEDFKSEPGFEIEPNGTAECSSKVTDAVCQEAARKWAEETCGEIAQVAGENCLRSTCGGWMISASQACWRRRLRKGCVRI